MKMPAKEFPVLYATSQRSESFQGPLQASQSMLAASLAQWAENMLLKRQRSAPQLGKLSKRSKSPPGEERYSHEQASDRAIARWSDQADDRSVKQSTRKNTHTSKHTYSYTYTYTCTHTHIPTYTHTHIHTITHNTKLNT